MYRDWSVWSIACCRNCCGGKGSFRAVVFAFLLEAIHNLHHAVGSEDQDRQFTYNVTLRCVPATIFMVQMQWVLHDLCVCVCVCVCVFVVLVTQHAMRMRRIVLCGLLGCTIYFHIITQTAWFSKEKSYWTEMCVSSFSTTFVRNVFNSKKNWTR